MTCIFYQSKKWLNLFIINHFSQRFARPLVFKAFNRLNLFSRYIQIYF